jgi:hypothetical protein
VFRRALWVPLGFLLLGALCVAASGLIGYGAYQDGSWVFGVLAAVLTAAGLLFVVLSVLSFNDSGPRLVLDAAGLTTLRGSHRTIPWSDIVEATLVTRSDQVGWTSTLVLTVAGATASRTTVAIDVKGLGGGGAYEVFREVKARAGLTGK